jgi:hypothetical protein
MIYTATGSLVNDRVTAFTWGTNEVDLGITLSYDGSNYRWILGAYSGSTYYFRTNTSTDMISWNTATTFVPSGLSNTRPYSNPYLFFPTNDDPILVFDYVEDYSASGDPLVNVYMMESSDNGASWGTPTAITTYDSYAQIGKQPAVAQTVENELLLTFLEEAPTLYMGRTATGWSPEAADHTYDFSYPGSLVFDQATRKIYHFETGDYTVDKEMHGITQIDLDSWTADDYWDATSTPVLLYANSTYMYTLNRMVNMVDGLIAFAVTRNIIAILNPVSNTIHYIAFRDDLGITQNVTWSHEESVSGYEYELNGIYIDTDGTIYFTFFVDRYNRQAWQVCTININDPGPTYTVNTLLLDGGAWSGGSPTITSTGSRAFPSEGYMICLDTKYRDIGVYTLSTSACVFVKVYSVGNHNIPDADILDVFVLGDYLYIAILDYSGLYKLNITNDDDAVRILPAIDSLISNINYDSTLNALLCTGLTGLHVYYLTSNEWVVYNATTVPGITPDGSAQFMIAHYDSTNDGFIIGINDPFAAGSNQGGVLFVPRSGKIQQIKYSSGSEDSGWTFDTPSQLVADFSASHATTAYVSGTNEFYALWSDIDSSDGSFHLAWDKDEVSADLSKYIVQNSAVKIRRNVLGDTNSLEFSLTPGQLFNPFNTASMLRKYLIKGRKLTLQGGETVSGTDYLENQGTYYADSRSIEYAKGNTKVINVIAKDKLEQIKAIEVHASAIQSNLSASTAFKNIAVEEGAVSALEDINTPLFINDKVITAQFIQQDLYEILYTIAWRFGTMIRYDMDNQLDTILVPGSGIDHTYSDNTALKTFNPNDNYSDYTNSVIVTGVHPDLTQVIHNEESVASISGTVGWWGDAETYTVYFDDKREKTVLNPRLKVISSAEPIAFYLAGGVTERIIDEDPDGKWVKVKVDAPNLIPALAVAMLGVLTGAEIPDISLTTGGPVIVVGKRVEAVSIFAALNILGSIASFQYEIWAQPVGYMQRTIQAEATDPDHISYMGQKFSKTLVGWECDSTSECAEVANRELVIPILQRKGVQINKIGHLQDEEGDRISIINPDTDEPMTMFVVELERIFVAGNKGKLQDSLKGWIV